MKYTNPYHALDEIGFIGTQEKRSKAQIKNDTEVMHQFIAAHKAGIPFVPISKKAKPRKSKK